ncbi:MAG: SpoIIE family protein phosphatase [Actinomycetota bacterium]|nr:SpoIIE family protein phosphatase [Actinomycetota bacterium]
MPAPELGFDLLASLPAGVAYLAGASHVFRFANDAYRLLVGGREILGKTVREALPELEGQGYFELLDDVFARGEAAGGRAAEVLLGAPDEERTPIFVDFCYQPVRQRGAVVGILVHAADVTAHVRDQRRLEQVSSELSASEERHRVLFATIPYGVVHHDAQGGIVAANPAATEILGVAEGDLLGLRPDDRRWQAVREDGASLSGRQHPAMVALATGRVTAPTIMGIAHGQTAQRRWLSVIGVPLERDGAGRVRRAYSVFSDVTEQRRADAALRERDSFLGRLRDANVLGVVISDEIGVRDANDAFLAMLGRDRADLAAGHLDWRSLSPPEWSVRDRQALEELRASGACQPFEKDYLHASGARIPVLVGAAVIDRDPLSWVTFVADLSARQRAEDERARLLASAQSARAEATRAEEGLQLLLRAGALATAPRDATQLLEHATQLLVPSLADFALVLLDAGDERLIPIAAAHRDAGRLTTERPALSPTSSALVAPFLTQRSELVVGLRDPAVRQSVLDPWSERLVEELAADSVASIPVRSAEHGWGVLIIGRGQERPPLSASELAVGEELGRRLADGLANAEAVAREHRVAETLQRALLPQHLPSIDGVDLAVEYLPATAGVEVGGDWFDVVALSEDALAVVVGDVMGHSIAAGAIMGQLRTILRTYAIDRVPPGALLERTNAAMAQMLSGALASAFCATFNTTTMELVYANAGHPPPLLAGAAEGSRFLAEPAGLMLGALPDSGYLDGRVQLREGAVLLAYTDGLVEARGRGLDTGLAELVAAIGPESCSSAARACATALERVLRSQHRGDDVCVLALRAGA